MIMDRKSSDKEFSKNKRKDEENKHSKQVRMSKDITGSKNYRSTSHNRPGIYKDKYKQHDTSGPITVKNSKLPSAFDVNHKGKRSMKSITKIEKKHQEAGYYKNSKNNNSGHPPKTSNGKIKKNEKEHPDKSPPKDEERKGAKEDYRQGVKNKPKTLINKKLPDVFNNPQIKYKSSKNDQYIKQMKDENRPKGRSYKSKQATLDPMSISIEQKKNMKKKLYDVATKAEKSAKIGAMAASKSNGFGQLNKISGDVQINSISPTNIKLQQMVSLALIKSSNLSGPIKKMLHVPSFSIY